MLERSPGYFGTRLVILFVESKQPGGATNYGFLDPVSRCEKEEKAIARRSSETLSTKEERVPVPKPVHTIKAYAARSATLPLAPLTSPRCGRKRKV
jgi:hypothetical protein